MAHPLEAGRSSKGPQFEGQCRRGRVEWAWPHLWRHFEARVGQASPSHLWWRHFPVETRRDGVGRWLCHRQAWSTRRNYLAAFAAAAVGHWAEQGQGTCPRACHRRQHTGRGGRIGRRHVLVLKKKSLIFLFLGLLSCLFILYLLPNQRA
jgi:hypothetical protein